MKKSFFKKNILAIAITALFVASVAYGAWSEPTAPFPTGRWIPVHEGPSQVKDGDLTVGGTFIANKAAQFMQDALFAGVIRGGSPSATNSTVYIGGTNAFGQKITQDLALNGYARSKGSVQVGCVATASNPCGVTDTSNNQLCADATGKIILCDTTAEPPVDTCPDGQVHTSDGSCGYTVHLDASTYPGTSIDGVSIPGYTTFPGKLCVSNCSKIVADGIHGTTAIAAGTPMSVTATGTTAANLGSNVSIELDGSVISNGCFNLSSTSKTYYFSSSNLILFPSKIRISIGSGNC